MSSSAQILRITEREPLLPGVAGTKQLVEKITTEIRRGARDEEVRDLTRRVLNLATPQHATAEIHAIWDYLTGLNGPPYRLDPVELQIITPAAAVERLRGADCKKFAIIAGAMLEAAGHPVEVRVIDQRPQVPGRGAEYHHVYLLVFNRDTGERLPFDPVAKSFRDPSATVGTELVHQARRDFMIRPADEQLEDQQLSGVFDTLKSFAQSFDPTRKGNEAIRGIISALPYGGAAVSAADALARVNNAAKAAKAAAAKAAPAARPPAALPPAALPGQPQVQTLALTQGPAPAPTGMSTLAKVGIGTGAVLGVGLLVVLIVKVAKPKPRRNPRKRAKKKGAKASAKRKARSAA